MIKIDGLREVDRIRNPTTKFFMEHYGMTCKPVLISGAMDHWKASKLWTLDFFATNFRDSRVLAVACMDDFDVKEFTVSTYVDYMRNSQDAYPYYLRNFQLHRGTPLVNDYELPEYFKSWDLQLPEDQRPPFSWIYFGARNTFSSLHLDIWNTSAWNALISGRKLWLFYPSEQGQYMYNGLVNPFEPDFEKYPYFTRATPTYCIQNPGEIVFTPSTWWHAVTNLEQGVSLTENFINQTNYKIVFDTLKKRGMREELAVLERLVDQNFVHMN